MVEWRVSNKKILWNFCPEEKCRDCGFSFNGTRVDIHYDVEDRGDGILTDLGHWLCEQCAIARGIIW